MSVASPEAGTDYSKFVDQRVVIKYNSRGTTNEVTGVLQAASDIGVMFKPKGRTTAEILELEQIEGIDFAPLKPKKMKPKTLKDLSFGQARQHLADRHGTPLSVLAGLDEQQALTLHEGIDHDDLGHVHESEAKATQAAAAALPSDNPDGADPQDEDEEDSDEYTDEEDERD